VKLYLCSLSGPSWPVLGWTLALFYLEYEYIKIKENTDKHAVLEYKTILQLKHQNSITFQPYVHHCQGVYIIIY